MAKTQPKPQAQDTDTPPVIDPRDLLLNKLVDEIEDLKKGQKPSPEAALTTAAQMSGVDVGPGGVKGINHKYSTDKSDYPDPTERLFKEPMFGHLALDKNYVFNWNVEGVVYEAHGVTYAEPRFTIQLFRVLRDEDGQPSGQLALVATNHLHEDTLMAQIAADKLGITEEFETTQQMLDESRYVQIRNWLHSVFNPKKHTEREGKRNTMVIDNQVVEIFDAEDVLSPEAAARAAQKVEAMPSI